MGGSRLVNRNITAGTGRTSMRLEPEVWDALREICLRESLELRDLIRAVEHKTAAGGRTSAVRVHVLQYYREAATETGHVQAGHGTTTATGPLHLLSQIEVPQAQIEVPQVPVMTVLDSSQMVVEADVEVSLEL